MLTVFQINDIILKLYEQWEGKWMNSEPVFYTSDYIDIIYSSLKEGQKVIKEDIQKIDESLYDYIKMKGTLVEK